MAEQDDTRRRILDAAGPIFAEKGFRAANVREIVQIAGANLAAVNYHFGSKDHLYTETVRLAYESCASAAPMPDWPAGTPAPRKLREFIHMFLSRIFAPDRPAWHQLLLMREVSQPTEACAQFVRDFVRPTFAALLGILDELLPANVPGSKRHLIGGSIIGQCLHYHHSRHVMRMVLGDEEAASFDISVLTDHVAEFSLAAIKRLYSVRAPKGRP